MPARAYAFVVLLVALGPVLPARAQEPDSLTRAAIEWVHLLRDGSFEEAAARVAPDSRAQMGAEGLAALWPQVTGQVGELSSLEPGTTSPVGGGRVVDLAGTFAAGRFTVRVAFDAEGRVAGFFLRPPAATAPGEAGGGDRGAWTPPAYVDTAAFREVDVVVGSEPWELPGTLTLPIGGDAAPGVVLVHGSGPHDRDETVGPNKPFRDLAWGLASRGVAVLRYDKRTLVHGARMADVGPDAEVVDDALAAADLLRDRPEVDPGAMFVLGHSLGGSLAPEIARRDGALAGVVILAGAARDFSVVLKQQLLHLRGLPENAAPEARARIDSLLAALDRYDAGELADSATLMGAPVSYVRALEALDPVSTLSALDVPALLLQGGRDYQVTVEDDLAAWRTGLAGRGEVEFREYPDLSHLFTPGEGMATPTEYATRPGHVAARVVEDVAAWIAGVAR